MLDADYNLQQQQRNQIGIQRKPSIFQATPSRTSTPLTQCSSLMENLFIANPGNF